MIEAASLAWKQLRHTKIRLAVALAGIAFADVLMFMQLGFQDALFASSVLLHTRLEGDLAMIHPRYQYLVSTQNFTRRYLYQALGYEGVESAAPLYIGLRGWENPQTYEIHPILVIGVDPDQASIDLGGMTENRARLKQPDVVLFDVTSWPKFGPIADAFQRGLPVTAQVEGRKVTVGGLFRLGTTFMSDGSILTSDLNFLRLFPGRKQGVIDIGLLKLRAGADIENVRRQLAADFSGKVRILTKDEFVRLEKDFWATNSPIGFIFWLGVVMGFIVGIVIVYQILYTDVTDRLPEYATLKAVGYSDFFLFSVVAYEALILAVLGYIPGLFVSSALYTLTERATALPMGMAPDKAGGMLVATIVMCAMSGAVALRKIKTADPAEIF